jgi:plastocyanin
MKAFISRILIVVIALGTNQAFSGAIKGKVTARGVRDNANAVVYIEKLPDKTFDAPKKHAQIDQKNLKFQPHVLPVLAGTTVDFLNSDDVLHNVFSPEKCTENFNLGSWPKGQTRSYTFKEAGCQPVILCNVHPEMAAYVVVLSTPYYAVSEKDGGYEIKDVPVGKYTLKIWHEKLKGESQEVTVSASGDVKADFLIKR